MSRLTVAAIVEGHGECSAVRTVVTRVWTELLGGEYVNVLRPIRRPRSKLIRPEELLDAIDLADLKLREHAADDPSLVLVIFDADEDLPCVVVPALLEVVRQSRSHLDVAIVLPKIEFETWFAAAAPSLTEFFDLSITAPAGDPEEAGQRKGTVVRWMHGQYAPRVDQVRLTQAMDLNLCRSRSKSFAKLCRELEKRL